MIVDEIIMTMKMIGTMGMLTPTARKEQEPEMKKVLVSSASLTLWMSWMVLMSWASWVSWECTDRDFVDVGMMMMMV